MTFLRIGTTDLSPPRSRFLEKPQKLPGNTLALPTLMGTGARIAVATRSGAERGALREWLDSGGFQAVPVADIGASTREIEALKFEMLIIDIELLTLGSLMRVA